MTGSRPVAQILPADGISTLQSTELGAEGSLLALRLIEANHKIANSLHLASSILSRDARTSVSIEARATLFAVASRINAIATLHRLLSRSSGTDLIDLGGYLRELCTEIGSSTFDGAGAEFGTVVIGNEPIHVASGTATDIGMIVAELLTNSVKHGGAKPICSVGLSMKADMIEISVADDGPGLSADFRSGNGSGSGFDVLRRLVARLKGQMVTIPSAIGAQFVITVPARSE